MLFYNPKLFRIRLLRWQRTYLSPTNLLFILAIVVGLAVGLIDVLVRTLAQKVVHYLSNDVVSGITPYLFFTLPLMGILITAFIVRFLNGGYLSKGIPSVMYSILKNGSRMQKRQMYMQPITALTTVGFGGSAGFEGPMVATGASLAANLGLWWGLDQKQRTTLIACAAAAVTAANFKAPITGVIFAVEVLHIELQTATVIPILFASIAGVVVNRWLFGTDILFNFTLNDQFMLRHVPFYVVFGVLSGFLSVHFGKISLYLEARFKSIGSRLLRALLGGGLLGICIFLFPPLFGEGYYAVKLLMQNQASQTMQHTLFATYQHSDWALILFLSFTLLLKTFACSFTSGGGGNGGIWAAFLFTGALGGYVFSHTINILPFGWHLSEPSFMLAGMAGLASGVLHAPLTAIFLAAEISNGYDLLLPFMIVSGLSHNITKYFMPYSVFQSALVKKGHWIANNRDKQLLTYLAWQPLVDKQIISLPPHTPLEQAVALIEPNSNNLFAVVDPALGELLGVVSLNELSPFLLHHQHLHHRSLADIMRLPTEILHTQTDSTEQVLQKFDSSQSWFLPVIDNEQFVGFLLKNTLFNAYRKQLTEV